MQFLRANTILSYPVRQHEQCCWGLALVVRKSRAQYSGFERSHIFLAKTKIYSILPKMNSVYEDSSEPKSEKMMGDREILDIDPRKESPLLVLKSANRIRGYTNEREQRLAEKSACAD